METTHEQSDSLLLFRVGPIACAVPAAVVDGIIQPPPLNHIPGSDPGVFARDHKVSSVIDLRRRFGLPSGAPSAGRMLLSHQDRSRFGYWVDEVIGLEQQRNVTLRPLPDYLPLGVFDAVLLRKNELVLVSDLDRLARLRGDGFISMHLDKIAQSKGMTPTEPSAPVKPRHRPPAEVTRTAPATATPVSQHAAAPSLPTSTQPRPEKRESNASAPLVTSARTGIADKVTLAPRPPVRTTPLRPPTPRTPVSTHSPLVSPRHESIITATPVLPDNMSRVANASSQPSPDATGSDAPLWLAFAITLTTALLLLGWLLWPVSPSLAPPVNMPPTLSSNRTPVPQTPGAQVAAVVIEETPQPAVVAAEPAPTPATTEPTDTPDTGPAEPPAAALETAESETFTAQIERQEDAIHIIIERSSRPRYKVSSVAPDFIDRDTLPTDPDTAVPLTEGGAEVSSTPEATAPAAQPSDNLPLPTAGSCSLVVHTVVPGDTLWAIAKRYVDNAWLYPELARLSNIANPHRIYPGQKIYIEFR